MRLVAVRNGEAGAWELLDQMHTLRARVFDDRLGWDVNVTDDREADEYDSFDPTYILAVTPDSSRVVGCARLLPGAGPTMLGRTFAALLDGNPMPCHPRLIESSRFCVDTSRADGVAGARGLHRVTLTLFAGILEWSISNGYSEVATVTDLRFERILARAGLPFRRLGAPRPIGNTNAIAGIIPATTEHALLVRPAGYTPFCADQARLAA